MRWLLRIIIRLESLVEAAVDLELHDDTQQHALVAGMNGALNSSSNESSEKATANQRSDPKHRMQPRSHLGSSHCDIYDGVCVGAPTSDTKEPYAVASPARHMV